MTSGSPRVVGDDEEDDVDDLENEFNYKKGEGKARQQMQYIEGNDRNQQPPQIPLLTNTRHVIVLRTITRKFIQLILHNSLVKSMFCRSRVSLMASHLNALQQNEDLMQIQVYLV